MQVLWSRAAEEDIEEIGLYIAQDNVTRALSFMDELETKAESLKFSPLKGVERGYLRPGLRLLPHGNYNIYYRVGDGVLSIVRVMHGARDIEPDDFA